VPVRIALLLGAVALVFGLAGCGRGASDGVARKKIVAAFYPLAFAAEQIGGSGVAVRNLTPAGAEPHDLELTPSDVRAVDGAALVLYLGNGFMPGLETAVAQRSGRSLDLLTGETLQTRPDAGGGTSLDPHVWLDPVRYASIVRRIGRALGDKAATDSLVSQVDLLDAEYKRVLAHCRRHDIVTSHAAFGYLAARYGLRQVPLEGLAPEAEPSARDIARLVDAVRASGATTVFFEPLVSPKLAQTVAREAKVKTAELDPIEGLSHDAIASGSNYFTVMRANLAALRTALGCTP
jgi:zinc transport system substrate-binding protein